MGDVKLKPVDEQIQVWDGYRGNNRIGWRMEGKGRGMEVFGTWCVHCLASWGWTPDPEHADRIHRAMKAKGCPRCERGDAGDPITRKPEPLPAAPRVATIEGVRERLRRNPSSSTKSKKD
jgi:hypothetical protein